MQSQKLKIGQYVELECKDLVPEGLGISYLNKELFGDKYKPLTGFIWGVLPEERFVARITRVHSSYFHGVLARLTELPQEWLGKTDFPTGDPVFALYNTSEERKKPPCDNFTLCGGCKLLHLDYEKTLTYKKKWLLLSLKGQKIDFENVKIISSPQEFYYRNHVQVHINLAGQKGFYAPYSYRVAPFPETGCLLFYQKLFEEKYPEIDKKVRCVRSRIDLQTKNVLTVPLYSPQDKNSTFTYHVAYPKSSVTSITIPNTAFFQVNLSILPLWLSQIENYFSQISISKKIFVLELFSGFGFITRVLAYLFPIEVVAFDILPKKEVQKARIENDRLGSEKLVDFVQNYYPVDLTNLLALEKTILPILQNKSFHLLLLNPPRAGLGIEQTRFFLKNLVFQETPKVIYSSCNPATFARDLKVFLENGFKIQDMVQFDFFPYTAHSEVLAFLTKE